MDKLKPILAQKFWIFFGLVLTMPVVGYFMTKGQLAAEIASRREALNKKFTEIPSGADSPNEEWIKQLTLLNEQRKLHNRKANAELWQVQKERMVWPSDIAAMMSKAEYFKPLSQDQGGGRVLDKYPLSYSEQVRKLWEIVDPLDDGRNLRERDSNMRRKIAFPMADLHQVDPQKWATLPISFEEVWGCQEDIWLQAELLQAIRRLNANAISQGDAFVKQLGKIVLFGGSKAAGDASASGVGGAASYMQPPGGAGAESSAFGGNISMGMGGRKSDTPISAEVNLAEEFIVSMEAGASGGNSQTSFTPGSEYPGGSGGATTTPGAVAGAGAKSDIKRYIDDVETQPYKRRGFYIKLVMDHRKVPDLIAELMNSPFPVEIVRVQQTWMSDSGTSTSGGGSPFMAGGGAGGSFGFGGGFTPPAAGNENIGAATPSADESGASSPYPGTGGSARSGTSGTGSLSAMADPNLAQVAILGVWTLYRPPAPAPDAGQPVPTDNTAAPVPAVAATPPAADATESTESSSEEAKKPDDADAPKAEPAKSEKSDSDADKPAEEKPASKDESSGQSESPAK